MNTEREIVNINLEYEHADDTPFLRLIGQYKTKRRAREARKDKEGILSRSQSFISRKRSLR